MTAQTRYRLTRFHYYKQTLFVLESGPCVMCWVVGGIKLLWIMKNVCSAVTRCRSFSELWHIAKGLLVYHGISQPAIDWWMGLQKYFRGRVTRGRLRFSIWWCEDVQSTGTKRIFTWDATIDRVVWWKWKHWRGIPPLHKRLTWRGGRWSFPSFRIICSNKFQVWATKVIDTRPSNWLQLEGNEGKRFNKNWKSKGTLNGLCCGQRKRLGRCPVTPWSNLIRNVCYRR